MLLVGVYDKYFLLLKYLYVHGKSFSDIDECDRGIDGCQHACRNNDGGFLCTCNTGYALAPNGKNCTGEYYS